MGPILSNILGYLFLLLGLLGFVLPILPGILFVFIGLYFLARTNCWAHNLLHKLKRKYPKISIKLKEFLPKSSFKSKYKKK